MFNKNFIQVALVLSVSLGSAAFAQSITTYHNDNNRTGVNPAETILTPGNVNPTQFGKLFSLAVDGQVYAQPLYLSGVEIPGKGTHNVVYVATESNSVYAFDADSGGTPLWRVNFGAPVLCAEIPGCNRDLLPNIGITSTPVIDTTRKAIFVVAETKTDDGASFALHSLNYATGEENLHSPALISGQVPGRGDNSVNGNVVFDPFMHWQRPGLLLLNGNIYIAFSGHQDTRPYHGWFFGYDGSSMRRVAVKCISPNGDSGGIWQGGGAPAADEAGNIYIESGNGTFDAWATGGADYGMSVIKMNGLSGLNVMGYFAPSDQQALDARDKDVGSGAPLLIPNTSYMVAGSKDGRIFVLDTNNLGGWNSSDKTVQEWQATNAVFGASVFYNSTLFVWGRNDLLKSYAFTGSGFSAPVSGGSVIPFDYQNTPGMSLSANGTVSSTGILWASYSKSRANGFAYPGILRAFAASDITVELWNSDMVAARDNAGSTAKWAPPTVINGKVYLPTFDNAVQVYGLLNDN